MEKTVSGQRIWILFKNLKTKTSKTKTSKTKTHKNIEHRSNLKDPISSQRNKRERLYLLKKQTGRKNRPGPEDGHFIEKSSKTKALKNLEQRPNLTAPVLSQRNKRE